ncbi:MAG: CvpA family protein [Anaerolineales bacterium]|nr:CvpA family protein [Anaerolineales bacterium]MCS7246669.1 CvpA family protein [Anaerolineales bacterium]MDW8160479.1 CvpA family protein [Anaerolineales bacterium]MDW8446206.1 CvpA family protein [Anaerolineales bacterium]
MISLVATFWLLVFIFGVIGAMRGWAKEVLVTFSAILALFILAVLERYVPPVRTFFDTREGISVFWTRTIVVLTLVFFGYQTPNIPKLSGGKFARDKLSDVLLGFVLGVLNGFLVISSVWYFLEQSGYPFPNIIVAPRPDHPGYEAAQDLLPLLAPRWLGIPTIFFAVILFALFVLVVFI